MKRRRRLLALVAAAVVVVLVVLWLLSRCTAGPSTVRVAAVGDMVCDPADPNFANTARDKGDNCRHVAVSDLAVALQPAVFLGLGDFQYELPKAAAYRSVYQQSYGRLYAKTIPVFGNQEYKVQDANTFTDYFGSRILDAKGYWSQEVGRWHVVVLNSNCAAVAGGCGTGSPQQEWLERDLDANGRTCVLAAWHHPRWSTGIAGHDPRTADLYQTLYDHGVELVLSGHDADYERFGPLDPAGKPDDKGVRQFVIGTGGQAHYRPTASAGAPASEFADYDHHGVLELNLAPDSYDWKFHVLEGSAPTEDAGRGTCH